MANIDLRPWREERRQARQKQFIIILLIVAVIAAGAGYSWNQSVQNKIKFQQARNTYLEEKNRELDVRIREINTLREQREALVERMSVIQSLQGDRPLIVYVFEQLVTTTPEGVYFTSLSMTDNSLRISAFADKTQSISDFLRNLDSSEWFASYQLGSVVAVKQGNETVGHRFELTVVRANPLKTDGGA